MYEILLADPPWEYEITGNRGAAAKHYPTMPLADLCALDVGSVCAPNCALFLWATWPKLPAALTLIAAWGFQYRAGAFTWVKRNKKSPTWFFGNGYWTRGNSEFVLLGVKGKPKRVDRGVSSLVEAPVMEHSRKPEEVHRRIERLMGDVPRLELFARRAQPGWDVAGNGVSGLDIATELALLREEQVLEELMAA